MPRPRNLPRVARETSVGAGRTECASNANAGSTASGLGVGGEEEQFHTASYLVARATREGNARVVRRFWSVPTLACLVPGPSHRTPTGVRHNGAVRKLIIGIGLSPRPRTGGRFRRGRVRRVPGFPRAPNRRITRVGSGGHLQRVPLPHPGTRRGNTRTSTSELPASRATWWAK